VERRITLTKAFTFSVICLLIVSAVLSYNLATKVNYQRIECERLGGIMVHGNGMGLCLKIESDNNEQVS
jgi:hypothetical protein